jgi:hypothetical protein
MSTFTPPPPPPPSLPTFIQSPASRLGAMITAYSSSTREALRGALLLQETELEIEYEKELEKERLEIERILALEQQLKIEQERLEKVVQDSPLTTKNLSDANEQVDNHLSTNVTMDATTSTTTTTTTSVEKDITLDCNPSISLKDENASDGPMYSNLDVSFSTYQQQQSQVEDDAIEKLRLATERHERAARQLEEISLQVQAAFFKSSSSSSSSMNQYKTRAELFATLGDLFLTIAEEELEFDYSNNTIATTTITDEIKDAIKDETNEGSPGPRQALPQDQHYYSTNSRTSVKSQKTIKSSIISKPFLRQGYELSSIHKEKRLSDVSPMSSINVAAAHASLLSTDRSAKTAQQARKHKASLESPRPIIRIVIPLVEGIYNTSK